MGRRGREFWQRLGFPLLFPSLPRGAEGNYLLKRRPRSHLFAVNNLGIAARLLNLSRPRITLIINRVSLSSDVIKARLRSRGGEGAGVWSSRDSCYSRLWGLNQQGWEGETEAVRSLHSNTL